ncbi:ATP-binding protein [Wolbachia endosymbiont (group B) of Apomyelois bistriatella]|uniref:ATP-binding protein n=1 Tax=Wolbachia endosymbiont (group B) of Apomyelois bistriatella TaxID=3066164 RepID=UPI003341450F
MKIINSKERAKMVTGVKIVIFGPYGIGKTSLLKTLDESTTLCLDFEAGLLAVQDWKGDSTEIRTWSQARDIACLIGGPNPALKSDQAYSQKHYEHVCSKHKDLLSEISKYRSIFIDSITVASRLCLLWARMQPECFSDRSGKEDKRAAYGLLAQEMMAWLNQFQHIRDKDIIIVGTLGQYLDDCNRSIWLPQCEGAKTASEIPGIVDEVISMVGIKKDDGTEKRSFVCQTINSWGYPAKDRSGCLNMVEEPHLGKLLTKIKAKTLAPIV